MDCPTPGVNAIVQNAMFVGEYSVASMSMLYSVSSMSTLYSRLVSQVAMSVILLPGVASLVASADLWATRYKVFARAQRPREEVITDMTEMLLVRDVYPCRATPFYRRPSGSNQLLLPH